MLKFQRINKTHRNVWITFATLKMMMTASVPSALLQSIYSRHHPKVLHIFQRNRLPIAGLVLLVCLFVPAPFLFVFLFQESIKGSNSECQMKLLTSLMIFFSSVDILGCPLKYPLKSSLSSM